MMGQRLKISVVIPTKNRFIDIIKCIESIMIQTLLPDEIVIVDASDTQDLNTELRLRFYKKIKIRYIHTKPGLTLQRNIGVRNCSGDIILFLDDDVILEDNFIKEIVKIFAHDSKNLVGGVYGNIINGNSKNISISNIILNYIYIKFATLFFLFKNSNNGKFQLSGFPTYPYGTDKIIKVEFAPGGLTAYRQEILNEFNFDENLQGYCSMEDVDFSYRVSRKYQIIYTPFAKLIHNVSPKARDEENKRMKMLIENHYYLFKKNFPQDIKHKFAFWWSVIGLFVMAIIIGNLEGLKGLRDGIINKIER